jgi:hypothetical protein
MRPEELRGLLNAQPFIPLRIHMTDGKTFDISHPEFVLILRSRVDIGIPQDSENGVLDRVEHCSLLHIVRVEELTTVETQF